MSNGTSKQSGVGKFLSGPLGGVAVQGGLGLIGGILGGIGSTLGQSIIKIFVKDLNQDPYID